MSLTNGEIYGWHIAREDYPIMYGVASVNDFVDEIKAGYDSLIDFSVYDTNRDGVLDGWDDSRIIFLTTRGKTGSGSTQMNKKGYFIDGVLIKEIAYSPGWYDFIKASNKEFEGLFSINDFDLRQPLHEAFHWLRSVDGYFQRYPNDYITIPDFYSTDNVSWSFYEKSYVSEDRYGSLYENRVSHMSAAVRELIGWDFPKTVDYGVDDFYFVRSFYYTAVYEDPTILKIPIFEGYDDKYYLVEARKRGGFDFAIPESGVFIQYINKKNFGNGHDRCIKEEPCGLNSLDIFASSLSPNISPTDGAKLFRLGQGYRDDVNNINIIVQSEGRDYETAVISVKYGDSILENDTFFSCNTHGSATNKEPFACEGFIHEKEDNTFDDCKDYGFSPISDRPMTKLSKFYVDDIKIEGPLMVGGEVKVILDVYCHPYNDVGIFFNKGNEWIKLSGQKCGLIGMSSFETIFKLPEKPGKYVIRGVESLNEISYCRDGFDDFFYDHDDILIDVKPA